MKKFLIKLLGGYTEEEMEITHHFTEDTNKLLSNEIKNLQYNRAQLNEILFHLADALHNFCEKNENTNLIDDDFTQKIRTVFKNLRTLSRFHPKQEINYHHYESINSELFNELKSFISCNLFIAVTTFKFSDESFEQFNHLFNRLLPNPNV